MAGANRCMTLTVAAGGGGAARSGGTIQKTVLDVLITVFGVQEGQRLGALPKNATERQAALAQAALAGEVVGDWEPIGDRVVFGNAAPGVPYAAGGGGGNAAGGVAGAAGGGGAGWVSK